MTISGINGISPLNGIGSISNPEKAAAAEQKNTSFTDSIKKSLDSVQKLQQEADYDIQQAVSGEGKDISEVMITTLKAEISMQLTLQIRNKALEAYQEITRMPV